VKKPMAIKITIPGFGDVEVEGAAQESTMQDILAAVQKSEKTKRKEETNKVAEEKKAADAEKKKTGLLNKASKAIEEYIEDIMEEQEKYKGAGGNIMRLGEAAGVVGKGLKDSVKNIAVTFGGLFTGLVSQYDEMAANPIAAGKNILQTAINLTRALVDIGIDVSVAIGKSIVGGILLVGDGLAAIVDGFGDLAKKIVDTASQVITMANEILGKELEKRAKMFVDLNKSFVSVAGGMAEMAALAGESGIGIANFTQAVVGARAQMQTMGLESATATRLIAQTLGAAGTAIAKGGNTVRSALFALGYSYAEQGTLVAQTMSRLKAVGVDIANASPVLLARETEKYAKHLKVLSDLTGQEATALLAQARAEGQRGALMTKLTAEQGIAFEDAYATLAALPGQQGPKLQAALAQMLAGGVVTDPVIAGNQIIMDMLKKTASQVSNANGNMVVNTQKNLAIAAEQYRAAGDSATDFATLMNPGGTSAVAQGMSQFGNALRQFRYDPLAGERAIEAADSQAATVDFFNELTATMTEFQVKMEGIAGNAIPMYVEAMTAATDVTMKMVTTGLEVITGQISMIGLIKKLMATENPQAGSGPTLSEMSGFSAGGDSGGAENLKSKIEKNPLPLETETKTPPPPPPPAAGYASGGIATGPSTGYPTVLHGTEAVVPLPDNKSIPVKLEGSVTTPGQNTEIARIDESKRQSDMAVQHTAKLTDEVKKQSELLTQILTTMQKNNNLTSGILQNSY